MIQLPFLTPAEKRFLELQALRKPANDDDKCCSCNVRAVADERIKRLVRELDAAKPRDRTFERRPHMQHIVLSPSPWLRRQLQIEEARAMADQEPAGL